MGKTEPGKMKKRTLYLIAALVLLLAYYSVICYIAKVWYSGIPEDIERVFGSPVLMGILYSGWVLVPAHMLVLLYLSYKRKINAGEFIMLLMVPIALAALFFPARG